MQGRIFKGIGSFYTVHTADGNEYVCKARGKFRKEGITPVVGDFVEFVIEKTGHSFITEIYERKNMLIRPAVSNLDKLIIVMSANVPKPDLYLTDKLIAACELYNILPVLVVNKCDGGEQESESIAKEYAQTGYPIYAISAKNGMGLDALKSEIAGSVCCFAGQSAVGKSSIMNALMPELALETGGLSRKTDRGRHTTRHAELWETGDGGALLDTPGFSLLENMETDPSQLADLYVEMRNVKDSCRFTGCAHVNEPDCAVKALVSQDKFSKGRYERYVNIYKEVSESFKHRYDK